MFKQFSFFIFVLVLNILTFFLITPRGHKTVLEGLEWNIYCKFQGDGFQCQEGSRPKERFYFDLKMQDCKPFLYGGCPHAHNTFSNMKDCRETCQDVGLHSIQEGNFTSDIYCRLQPDFGKCQSYHPLWYYDITRQQCRGFSYSGCGGNRNRFRSNQECMGVCSKARTVAVAHVNEDHTETVSVFHAGHKNKTEMETLDYDTTCKFQADSNNCEIRLLQKFYFDLKMEDCKPFLYGGCKPSYNTFDTMALCREACQDEGLHPASYNVSSNVFCRYQPDFGECQDYYPLWYYDIVRHQCRGFSYSGCGGNRNKFKSYQSCMGACGRFRDESKIKEEERQII